ncbi:MAG: type I CRISPR-associated protein Cas7 [Gammaproteobacteria bacterium]|nr:type I CRISPR-associated protein Cas7 [Gammaproteobacteria bacterium]
MNAPFNRCIGLVILDVTMSNPNGDPDMESDPRTIDASGLGLITPVSFKRKLRDLVGDQSPVFDAASEHLGLNSDSPRKFEILETRGRNRNQIINLSKDDFQGTYWDARVFGNTFLESLEDSEKDHFIRTGVIQIGVGQSVAPVEIERITMTNKAGVEGDKDRGMAPLAFRVVRHGIYTIPFYVNPSIAQKTGMDTNDLELFKFLVPHAYQHTASAIRPQITMLHAWFAEHMNPLGSCPDYKLIDTLIPRVKDDIEQPTNKHNYDIPEKSDIPEAVLDRFNEVIDLCDA